MKRIVILLIVLGILLGGLYFFFCFEKEAPPADFPTFFTESEKEIFRNGFSNEWNKIGLRRGYIATIQPSKIYAKNERGETKTFAKNINVGFRDWDRKDDKFIYKFSYDNEIYTYESEFPFDLFYDIRSNRIDSWRNLWGYKAEDKKKEFELIYKKIQRGFLSSSNNENLRFAWLRRLNFNYESHLNNELLTISACENANMPVEKIYKLKFRVNEEDVTPTMLNYLYKMVRKQLLYVHRPNGVQLFDDDFKQLKGKEKTEIFSGKKKKETAPFYFLGYTYHDNQKFIKTYYNGNMNRIVMVKVNFFDDLLPLKVSETNYEHIVKEISRKRKLTCDEIIISFVYLDRQLDYNLFKNPDSPKRFKDLITALSSKINNCETKTIGPRKKLEIPNKTANQKVPKRLRPKSYANKEIRVLPDPIVRAYYNNIDFLIPAWLNYNSKKGHRLTGVRANPNPKFEYGYNVMKGYTVQVPTLKNLLLDADLSKILQGHGFERIIFNKDTRAVVMENRNFREKLNERAETKENAVLFSTNSSYEEIVGNAYGRENLTISEIDIFAKALREFNHLLKKKMKVPVAGREMELQNRSVGNKKVVVPIQYEQLGIEKRPIKGKPKYKIRIK